MRRWLPFVMLLAAAGPASAATLTVGPYLQDPRPDGIVIAWETDVDSEGAVEFGHTPAYGTSTGSAGVGTRHEVALSGLAPGEGYHYRVRVDGEPSGGEGTFQTAPVGREPFQFLVYGDCRSDYDAHALVVAAMLPHPAPFVITTGDLVSDGGVAEQWDGYFRIVAPLVRDAVVFPVIGNHDEVGKQAPDTWWRRFLPPAPDAGHPTYYAWTWANSRFIVLDGYAAVVADVACLFRLKALEECMDAAQTDWLEARLAEAATDPAIDHVFVFVHQGPYSSKPDRSGWAEMRAWLGRFVSSKVKIVFSGHDHYYEHGLAANRLPYVVSGGGGASLYETQPESSVVANPRRVLVSTSVYNFQVVKVDGLAIDVVSYQPDGTELDRFAVEPRRACTEVSDCESGEPGFCEGSWTCDDLYRCAWTCKLPHECEVAEECAILTAGDCAGRWDCIDFHCAWTCDAGPDGDVPAGPDVALTADASGDAPTAQADPAPESATPLPDDAITHRDPPRLGCVAAAGGSVFTALLVLFAAMVLVRVRET